MAHDRIRNWRRRVYQVLEQGPVGDRASVVVDRLLVLLIIVNLVAVALESMPQLHDRYLLLFDTIEFVSLVVFTAEYLLRIWSSVEYGPHRHMSPTAARLRYILSPAGLVDLVAVLPFWFAPFVPSDLRVLQVLRVVRFFKIARAVDHSPAVLAVFYYLYNLEE